MPRTALDWRAIAQKEEENIATKAAAQQSALGVVNDPPDLTPFVQEPTPFLNLNSRGSSRREIDAFNAFREQERNTPGPFAPQPHTLPPDDSFSFGDIPGGLNTLRRSLNMSSADLLDQSVDMLTTDNLMLNPNLGMDMLGLGRHPITDSFDDPSEAMNEALKFVLNKTVGMEAAMNEPPTEFMEKHPRTGDFITGTGQLLPELLSILAMRRPLSPKFATSTEIVYEKLAKTIPALFKKFGPNLAPQVASKLGLAGVEGAGALAGGLAKGEPEEALQNALLFPLLGLAGTEVAQLAKTAIGTTAKGVGETFADTVGKNVIKPGLKKLKAGAKIADRKGGEFVDIAGEAVEDTSSKLLKKFRESPLASQQGGAIVDDARGVSKSSVKQLEKEAAAVQPKAVKAHEELIPALNRTVKDIPGAKILDGGTKAPENAVTKVIRKRTIEGKPQYQVTDTKDLSRATIQVADEADIPAAIAGLNKQSKGGWTVESTVETPLNHFGYRGVTATKKMASGITSEVQIHSKKSWKLKEWSDKIYKKWRNTPKRELKNNPEYAADLAESKARWNKHWEGRDVQALEADIKASASAKDIGRADIQKSPIISSSPSTQAPSVGSQTVKSSALTREPSAATPKGLSSPSGKVTDITPPSAATIAAKESGVKGSILERFRIKSGPLAGQRGAIGGGKKPPKKPTKKAKPEISDKVLPGAVTPKVKGKPGKEPTTKFVKKVKQPKEGGATKNVEAPTLRPDGTPIEPAKKKILKQIAPNITEAEADTLSGTYLATSGRKMSPKELKVTKSIYTRESKNIAEARRYKRTWEMVDEEATAAMKREGATFDTKTGQVFVNGKEVTKGTALEDTALHVLKKMQIKAEKEMERMALKLENSPASKTAQVEFDHALETVAIITNRFYGARAEAGRALNVLKKLTKPGDIYERLVLRFLRGTDPDKRQLIMEEILNASRQVRINLAKGMAEADATAPLRKIMRDYTNASFLEKFVEWSVMIKLTGLTTQAVNQLSNAAFRMSQPPIKLMAGLVDLPLAAGRKMTGKGGREVFLGESLADTVGMMMAFKQSWKEGWMALRTGVQKGTKGEEVQFFRPAIKGKIGEIIRTPGRLLGAGDAWGRPFSRNAQLWSDAYRIASKEVGLRHPQKFAARMQELIREPTKEMMEKAESEATRLLFQEELSGFAKSIQASRAKHPMMRLFLPFLKTPINIMKEGHKHLPTGIILKSVRNDIGAGGARRAEAIARIGFGTSVSATLVGLALGSDFIDITAGGGNWRQSKFLRETGNFSPYSIRIGNTWYSYRRFQPFTTWLGFAGAAVDAWKNRDYLTYSEMAQRMTADMYNNTKDETYLRGVSDFIDYLENVEDTFKEGGKSTAANRFVGDLLVGSTVPVIIKQIAATAQSGKSGDPVMRDNQTIMQRIGRSVPGVASAVPSRIGTLGDEVELQGETTDAAQFLSPATKGAPLRVLKSFLPSNVLRKIFRPTKAQDDPVLIELGDLHRSTGFSISSPDKTYKGVRLKPMEYRDFLRRTGPVLKEEIYAAVNNKRTVKVNRKNMFWKDMDNFQKEKALRKVRDEIYKEFRGIKDKVGNNWYERVLKRKLRAEGNLHNRRATLRRLHNAGHISDKDFPFWMKAVEGMR